MVQLPRMTRRHRKCVPTCRSHRAWRDGYDTLIVHFVSQINNVVCFLASLTKLLRWDFSYLIAIVCIVLCYRIWLSMSSTVISLVLTDLFSSITLHARRPDRRYVSSRQWIRTRLPGSSRRTRYARFTLGSFFTKTHVTFCPLRPGRSVDTLYNTNQQTFSSLNSDV